MSNGFSQKEKDALNNVNRQAGQKLSKVVSALLGKTVLLTFRKSTIAGADALSGQIPGAQLCLIYSAGPERKGMMIVPSRIGVLMGELILGNDGQNLPPDFTDQNKDACVQIFQKIIEAQAAALSQVVGAKYEFRQDEARLAPPAEAAAALSGSGDWLLIEYGLGIQGFFEDTVYDLIPVSLAADIARAAAAKLTGTGSQTNAWNLGQVSGDKQSGSIADLSMLLDTPLHLTVELGKTKMSLKHILELGIGSIVELDKLAGEPVDIKVNNKLLAKGEVVVIDDNFGVRIVNISKPDERV